MLTRLGWAFVMLTFSPTLMTAASAQQVRSGTSPELTQLRAENERLSAEIQRLTAEVTRLTAEVNRLSSGAAAGGGLQRQEALGALRAVQSVVAGGGSRTDLRKYALEAKIKVDPLPDTPENAPLKEVSQIFTDAASLFTAATTQSMSAAEVGYFKRQYGTHPTIGEALLKGFGDIPERGFQRDSSTTSRVAAISAEMCGQFLLLAARDALSRIK